MPYAKATVREPDRDGLGDFDGCGEDDLEREGVGEVATRGGTVRVGVGTSAEGRATVGDGLAVADVGGGHFSRRRIPRGGCDACLGRPGMCGTGVRCLGICGAGARR